MNYLYVMIGGALGAASFSAAFTTFSTINTETIIAIEGGLLWQPPLYVATSVVIGFLLFWWGKHLI